MAFTPDQIASAVAFYTGSQLRQQKIIQNPSASLKRAGSTPAPLPIGNGGAVAGGKQGGKTISDKLREGTGNALLDMLSTGHREIAALALEPMDEHEAPTNAVQWILNALGTGTYATANAANEAGREVAKLREDFDPNDIGKLIQGNLSVTGAALRGLGMGVAEGFGARFDRDGDGREERARTWGQNFEDLGVNDAIREGTRKLGATDTGAGFWDNTGTYVGLAGLAGDILLDPLTYVLGTGALKGISGAARGARQAAEAGQGVRGVVGGAVREGAAARQAALDELRLARQERKQLRQIRRSGGGEAPDPIQTLLAQGARQADEPARAAEEAIARVDDAATRVEKVIEDSSAPALRGVESPASRVAALDDLARSPEVVGTSARQLDVDKVFSDARVAISEGDLPADAASAFSRTLREATKVPEAKAALKALAESSPTAKKYLQGVKLTVGGKQYTMTQAVEAAAIRLSAGDPRAREFVSAIDEALQAGVGRVGITPQSLAASIARNVEGAADEPAEVLSQLLSRIGTEKTMAGKKQVVLDHFGLKKTRFQGFDDLMTHMAAGHALEAPPEILREMLKALGIRSKITDPDVLKKTLAGRGSFNWETLQTSLRSPREVVTDHGITPEAASVAAVLDDVEVQRIALRDYDAYVRELGYDPSKINMPKYNANGTPRAGAGTGNAIAHGLASLGRILRGKQESEAFTSAVAVQMHKAVMSTLKLSRAKSTGAARGEAILPQYLPAMRAIEEYARSIGQVPYWRSRTPGESNLYVSLGQVVEALPEQVAARWLSGPMAYRRGSEVGAETYREGLSIYPSTLYAGAAAAVRGASSGRSGNELATFVREAMEAEARGKNAFQKSELGQRQLTELAESLAHENFLARIRPLHAAQEAQWLRMSQATAGKVLTPITTRISAILARDGDRGELVTELRRAYDDIARQTELDDGHSLARDLANSRMDNALVNGLLDEFDTVLSRFDARAATTTPKVGKAQTGAAAAKTSAETRKAAAENKVALLDEAEDLVEENVSELIVRGELENTLATAMATKAELQVDALMNGLWGKVAGGIQNLARAAKGSYGQGELNAARQIAERSSKSLDHQMKANVDNWLNGSRGNPGALQRLGDALGLGRPASIAEFDAASRTWWAALGAHIRVDLGAIPARGALRQALVTGLPRAPRQGIRDAVPPLSEAQADLAMELYDRILRVFNPRGGPFERSGLTPEDVNYYLKRTGMSEFSLKEGLPLAEQANIWATLDNVQHPLNVLLGFHRAMTLAYQRPMLAAMVMKQVGVRRGTEAGDELARAGWRAIDPTAGGTLGKHFDPDVLLPPDVHKQLAWVQRYLDDLDIDPRSNALRGVYRVSGSVAAILKPSMTTWRPGHHGTIIMGNNLFMLAHGFNPLQNGRVLRTMRLLSGDSAYGPRSVRMADDEFEAAFSKLEQEWNRDLLDEIAPGIEGTMKPRMLDQGVTFASKTGEARRLEPEELAFLARRYGVIQDPHQAVDLIPDREAINLTSLGQRIGQSRFNVIAKANRAIGRATSVEENVTRLSVMYQVLESRKWNSIEEAMQQVMRKVMDTHPTREALSAAERRHATHLMLFYTWMKGALGSIVSTMLERPGMVTIPSKIQYNQAQGYGLDPESFGKPIPSDPRIASYYQEGVIGPQWAGGLSPFGGTGDLPEGEEPHLWGASLNAPQIDALSSFFGGVNFGGDPFENARRLASGLNPVYSAPVELITNKQLGIDTSKKVSDNYADWLWQQTGFPAAVTNMAGLTGVKSSLTEEERAGDQARKVVNFLTGAKVTDYTNRTSATIASSERGQKELKYLREMGYTDEEIRWIRAWWKETRAAQG